MCGIIGIKLFNKNPIKSDFDSVVSALKDQGHRGPDFNKAIITGRSVLGHNRLAIIDRNPRSNQPITDDSGRYTLIYNGEIYNYHDLKNELLALGYTFKTSSDTEVLLYFLIEFGEKCLNKLNGCFAFAFYDNVDDELILARDHIGINPLLFSIQDDRILFASELRAFFKLSDKLEVDKKALSELFKFTYIPAPNSMLKNVHKMLPGHYVVVKGSALDVVKYWKPNTTTPFEGTRKEAVDKTRKLLEESVIKRMEADVPLGTFLSGGVDSSIVSAIAAKNKDQLHTFSIGFKDSPFFDESY